MTCAACDSATCSHSDPVYAGIHPSSPGAAQFRASGPYLTGGGAIPVAAGGFVDQRAGDREANGFGCGGEGFTVHNGGDTNAVQ